MIISKYNKRARRWVFNPDTKTWFRAPANGVGQFVQAVINGKTCHLPLSEYNRLTKEVSNG